ncbi:hypothetical protein A2690_00540 [Candidatus Roizmanbacteria bacterium RIFCSPHIGHO2_01_FULL_39_12b]|uniref:ABC transporter domain-containing protein n=1 Tax=Candidatus Roizmanbacteria bacterium RIFCSPHIGHO2_01_FULL_39_12b TaxID=1802030 RepID=A0A1F7G916_9BACT|nr:MAG: hypothetical protein A2690_00540 [Candidatus Roizmanbacteria bacterium RIFCSPHIGHO2_01_FULL_39_12b]OGK46048.1 MAG: hypothetical protein A3B46_00830 [Candidatus Roizmanbacteria bacterium RIFCSPLOWO2_01_FULL_39_19]
MVNFQKVSKKFGTTTAVSDLTFSIKEGEIVGLLGLNGAGKTTTMRLIVGALSPNEGVVRVNNYDPIANHLNTASLIGYLPENNPLYLDMLVKEYLKFVSAVKEKTSDDYFTDIIRQTGLIGYLNKKIETLSRGYKQRVGLATALLGDPKIIILDEPTSGLDPIEQEKIKDLIVNLGKNKTIIFSTHILSEVEDIATRLLILNKGIIVYDGENPRKLGSVEVLFKKYVS